MNIVSIPSIPTMVGQEVSVRGWVYNLRSSGNVVFLQIRDGRGRIQAVASASEISTAEWAVVESLTIESTVEIIGSVRRDERSPSGVELAVRSVHLIHRAEEYPITKKEHGVDFLMNHRHLWLRSARQSAILQVRDAIVRALRQGMYDLGFTLTDSPILTPTAAEGTTTLFKTDYFGEPAYLAQTGQLYIEATAAALGRVYDFGPTFRAEKSKTRRHLTEFWMLDAEAAFVAFEENLRIQEQLIIKVIDRILGECQEQFKILERDLTPLQAIRSPFPRQTYTAAVAKIKRLGGTMSEGDDFGADEEQKLSEQTEQPQFITHYPTAIKAFYMKPDPKDPTYALNADLLAPEGYGEVVGGSERIDDAELLIERIQQLGLRREDYEWYIDLRRYGSFPHSGFGLGLERMVSWICKLDHVRESIPFPRLLNRLRP